MAEMEGEIREGFLCPMCMQDLGTVSQLQQHFDEAHPNEDSDVIQQIKGRHIVGHYKYWSKSPNFTYSSSKKNSV